MVSIASLSITSSSNSRLKSVAATLPVGANCHDFPSVKPTLTPVHGLRNPRWISLSKSLMRYRNQY